MALICILCVLGGFVLGVIFTITFRYPPYYGVLNVIKDDDCDQLFLEISEQTNTITKHKRIMLSVKEVTR